MNIGIIGSGNVGGTFGKRWAQAGHNVVFSVRGSPSPALLEVMKQAGPTARTGSAQQAASTSDVVLLATPWEAVRQALASAGDLRGKIVIDATNPLSPGLAGLSVGTTTSAAEMVAQWTPGAKVVKAFNTVGYNIMDNPNFESGPVSMFYCGDDTDAKRTVSSLIAELGFEPLDAGPLTQARVLEPFAMLWISMAIQYGYGRDIGFRLLRR
jgi:NADPH-dependent F420 reductase